MNILFLCTGNSARSILGEVICNELLAGQGIAYSAGSKPVGEVNPAAIITLKNHGNSTHGLYSKNIDEFTKSSAPKIDLLISVCDNAASDCPVWLGNGEPKRLHWPMADPASVTGLTEKAAAFEDTYQILKSKLSELLS